MLKLFSWVKRYWYIPLIVLVGLLGFIFGGRRKSPLTQTKVELEAIKASTEAAKMKVAVGAYEARKVVEEEYQETLAQLDEEKKQQAKELKNDPAKLAKFLVRAGAKSR